MIRNNIYKYNRFSANNIEPKGWILDQLKTQLNGLSGHLHEFWPSIKDSSWIDGNIYSFECVPYWLDGLIPLAFLLNDEKYIKIIQKYIYAIISKQQEDGWIGLGNKEDYDLWGVFIIVKALYEYYQVKKEKKILTSIYKALKSLNVYMDNHDFKGWGQYRWFECYNVIAYIYGIYNEQWLLDLANKLYQRGFDYYSFYHEGFPKKKCPMNKWELCTHGVNNAMAVKAYALVGALNKNINEIKKSDYMLRTLIKYHGTIMGNINADECLSGKDPRQGGELCSIVELMFSLEEMTLLNGSSKYFDQLERIAFNALPNALTNDMWAHQYDTQVNAPFILRDKKYLWNSNGPESNIYGLEPHFGCCTSNYHQGWPKFVCTAVMYKRNTIVFNSYIPLRISTKKYTIEVESFYPFKKSIHISIEARCEGVIKFRIPNHADDFIVNDSSYKNRTYAKLKYKKGTNVYEIKIVNGAHFERRGNYYSLVNLPLVYGLKINQKKVRINEGDPLKAYPHSDYEFHNTEEYAYNLSELKFVETNIDCDESKSPFVSEMAPTSYLVKCNYIAHRKVGNYALFFKGIISKNIEKEFIPIGINKLHIGALKREDKDE